MKKIKLGLVVGCFFFSVFSAIAAELKFVVVDIQTVVNESKAGKESIAQLKKKFQKDETNLKNQENRIQNLRRELQQSSLLKKSAKEKKQEELIKIQQIFNREREVFFQKVNVEEKKLRDKILAEIRVIVNKISKKKKYDYVFERNIERFILFSKSNIKNITKEIIKEYDKTKK